MQLKIVHNISLERISDLLCSALEGGSHYWAEIRRYEKPKHLQFRTSKKLIFKHLDYPLNAGGVVFIRDNESDDDAVYSLNLAAIKKGLHIMAKEYPRDFADFLQENDDQETGDTFLQCCLMGKAIYG